MADLPSGRCREAGSLLAASDGSEAALGALHLARRLAHRDGHTVEVVGVVPPLPVLDSDLGGALPEARIYESRRTSLRQRLEAQIEGVGGDPDRWQITVLDGSPAPRIVDAADRVDADLVVLGLGRHGVVERFLGSETALRVAQIGHRPVLAVPAAVRSLPRRLVVAVDFSPFSERAAHTAATLVESPCETHLLHVLSDLEDLPFEDDGWRRSYRNEVTDRLDDLRAALELPRGCSCETVILSGDPAEELLSYADDVGADLVAAGSHGHAFFARLVLGSVSSRLLRGAHRSVLVAPPPPTGPDAEPTRTIADPGR